MINFQSFHFFTALNPTNKEDVDFVATGNDTDLANLLGNLQAPITDQERFRAPSPEITLAQELATLEHNVIKPVDTYGTGMQKFYFTINRRSVFVAARCAHDENTLVHNGKIPEGHGKLLMTSVVATRALSWTDYDPDKHTPGAYLIWNLKETRQLNVSKYAPQRSQPSDYSGANEVERGRKKNTS